MALCIECLEEYSDKRRKLGYKTCLECGDVDAAKEIIRKASCVAPAYNKGPYMLITSKEDVKGIFKTADNYKK
jgi:hypothetical protein